MAEVDEEEVKLAHDEILKSVAEYVKATEAYYRAVHGRSRTTTEYAFYVEDAVNAKNSMDECAQRIVDSYYEWEYAKDPPPDEEEEEEE